MAIKEKDFIEIEYTGTVKGEDIVFDTTDRTKARDFGIDRPNTEFGPVVICAGQGQLLKGLDQKIIGKELGKHKIELDPDEGFGKKSVKLIQLISTSKFKKQDINPTPGLQVEIDGMTGFIKTVSGGRTLVDFNHPLASKELVYDVDIKKIVADPKEKAEGFLKVSMGMKPKVEVKGKEAVIEMPKLPDEITKTLSEKILDVIPEFEKVTFKEPEKKEAKNPEEKSREEPKEEPKKATPRE